MRREGGREGGTKRRETSEGREGKGREGREGKGGGKRGIIYSDIIYLTMIIIINACSGRASAYIIYMYSKQCVVGLSPT